MNLYFWFFALYAVLITPIRLQADFLLGRGVRYRLRVQLAGVTLVRDRMHNSHALTLHSDGANLPLWLGILRQGAIRPVLRALRMQHACAMLETGDFSVQQIAEASGFSDVKYFRTAFRAYYGMTCGEYCRRLAQSRSD